MKTQRLNLLEAMNFAMAGYTVTSYAGDIRMKLKNDCIAMYTEKVPRGKKITSELIRAFQDFQWHAGDDRSITGYYDD